MFKKMIALIGMLTLLISMISFPAMADAMRVVTIGQDLSDEQEAFILNYFGADLNTCQVIYVNNQQEREYVGSWIPLEQIGNMTISSAYVQPTNSGGIQVKTANLTYVTGNMIASVLSTAGVKNCNIVAAAPFPVSGTGALTGVMIAYQTAMGEPLDESRRDLAVQEFTVTQQASESIGEEEALQLVNAVKMEVIQSEVDADNTEQIQQIVDQVIDHMEEGRKQKEVTNIDNSTTINNYGLSDEERQLILDLAAEIAKQDYQYEDMKETLERVEDNLSGQTNININIDNSNQVSADDNSTVDIAVNNDTDISNDPSIVIDDEQDINIDNSDVVENDVENDQDSILSNTNDNLIDPNYQSSTRKEDIEAIEEAIQEEEENTEFTDLPYDMTIVDEYTEDPEDLVIEDPQENEDPYAMDEDFFEVPEDDYVEEDLTEEDTEPSEEPFPEELPAEESMEKTAVQAAFAPNFSEIAVDYVLRLYVNQPEFSIVSGSLEIMNAFGEEIGQVDLTDEEHVITVAMTEEELDSFEWQEGTAIHIFLPKDQLAPDMSFYAQAESEDSILIGNTDAKWDGAEAGIQADSVDAMRKDAFVDLISHVEDGVTVRFQEDPEYVELMDYGNGNAQLHLIQEGNTVITLHYFDADGIEFDYDDVMIWIYPEKE